MRALPEQRGVTPAMFAREIRPAARPVVMRGVVADWPVVRAAQAGELAEYLSGMATATPVQHVRAAPETEGMLHYEDALRGPNFTRAAAPIADFMAALGLEAAKPRPDTLAVQGLVTRECLPGFAAANALPLLPPSVIPRVWIGNAAKVAIHNDPSENIACVVAGRRRFTLFAPDQLPNLYMGPFHVTPAGTPVSMVHLTRPDLDRYPRFAEALATAEEAELEPGDALYIPYGWYHHVEALDPVGMLVNFWWDVARPDVGSPWDALMHGMMTLRNLPADQRHVWRAMFEHYVFLAHGDPGEHLPEHARGVLGATTPRDVQQMRLGLIAKLRRDAEGR